MKSKPHLPLFASTAMLSASAVLTITLSLGGIAQAADFTWDGTTNTWDSAHWTPGPVAGPTANTDTATINGGQVTINGQTIDSPIFIDSLATVVAFADSSIGFNVVLGGNLTGSGTLTKTGDYSLLLQGDNSGFSGTVNATASNTFFQADSAGSAAANWTITGGAKIISNQSGTGHVIQLGSLAGDSGYLGNNSDDNSVTFEIGGNGNPTSFGGQIVDTPPGWGSSTTAITKVGGGTLTLTGSNGYTGSTTVTGGTLNLQGSGGAGTDYNGGNININGASTLRVSGPRYNFAGKTFTFDSVGGGTIDAIASGAGGFVFMGNNTFTTSGGAQNIISGTKSGNEGFNLNGSSAIFDVASGSDTTSDLKVTGTIWNGGGVTKDGAGRMEISSTQEYAGTTTVNEGTLILGNGTNNIGLSDTNDVVVVSGATLHLNYLVGNFDEIDELTLGGVPMSPGFYGAGTYSGVTITGAGTLKVLNGPTGSDYNTWGAPYGLTAGSEGGDLDNHGLTNQEEYAFGMIPNSGSSINPITAQLSKATSQFSYQRRDNALTGLAYTVWYSTDLSVWAQDTGVSQPEGTPDGNGVETITATLSTLPGNPLPAKLFIQVRAN